MPLGTIIRRSIAAPTALALALAIAPAGPVSAQEGAIDVSSLGSVGTDLIPGSLGLLPVGSTTELLGSVGSSDIPVAAGSMDTSIGTPSRVDPGIETTELLGIEQNAGDAYEYWSIQSAAMKRVVTVEVVRSRGEGAAPVLYMLDGVEAPSPRTGWNRSGDIHEVMADKNVHLVNPAGAYASYYSDWEVEDPALGNHKWETFLTKELPLIVESQLTTNGRSAVAGNSMGAQSAMHLAAQHPGLYDAVMAFSGNYSTMDELGYQTLRLSVETRGGDIDNMWGPRGSERWEYHDTISHPEKLKDTTVYLSAANGVVGPEDPSNYGGQVYNLWFGIVLERGSFEATKAFARALDRAGVDYQADYLETGLHNWSTFMRNVEKGWAYIEPSLRSPRS